MAIIPKSLAMSFKNILYSNLQPKYIRTNDFKQKFIKKNIILSEIKNKKNRLLQIFKITYKMVIAVRHQVLFKVNP